MLTLIKCVPLCLNLTLSSEMLNWTLTKSEELNLVSKSFFKNRRGSVKNFFHYSLFQEIHNGRCAQVNNYIPTDLDISWADRQCCRSGEADTLELWLASCQRASLQRSRLQQSCWSTSKTRRLKKKLPSCLMHQKILKKLSQNSFIHLISL